MIIILLAATWAICTLVAVIFLNFHNNFLLYFAYDITCAKISRGVFFRRGSKILLPYFCALLAVYGSDVIKYKKGEGDIAQRREQNYFISKKRNEFISRLSARLHILRFKKRLLSYGTRL